MADLTADRWASLTETKRLLVELGYDPGQIVHTSMSVYGYEVWNRMDRVRWQKREHGERIARAMVLDAESMVAARAADVVNHPPHYTSDPSGVECITITRHRNFNVGNAIKYLWRAGLKVEANKTDEAKQVEDLRKAVWYIEDEIKRLEAQRENA